MPSLGLGLGLDKSQGLILAPEAASWAAAVVAAGSSVPASVVFAVSEFVRGCQADASPNAGVNNWTAMKSVQLLAGPATFAGISAPLKGAAPTFFNFVGGDYNPATGLLGDGSTKYINSNRAGNADPQDNTSWGAYVTTVDTAGTNKAVLGNVAGSGAGQILIVSTSGAYDVRCKSGAATTLSVAVVAFVGVSRSVAGSYVARNAGTSQTISTASDGNASANVTVFARTGTVGFSAHRIAFYFGGEAVDLTALNARLTTLMASIAAAHP